MKYLLDTNVICETIKRSPDVQVIGWLHSVPSTTCYLSVLTLGEIRKGVEKIEDSSHKQRIVHWLATDLIHFFSGRIIEVDREVADKWGYLMSQKTFPAIDGLLAATAMVHNCLLVTRNIKDFHSIGGLEYFNPWVG